VYDRLFNLTIISSLTLLCVSATCGPIVHSSEQCSQFKVRAGQKANPVPGQTEQNVTAIMIKGQKCSLCGPAAAAI